MKLYIEGGGDSKSLHIQCREGFRKLLEKAGFSGRMPSTKACGSRNEAYDDFKTALKSAKPGEYPVLLVDSENPVELLKDDEDGVPPKYKHTPWQHLQSRDGWQKPLEANDDQAQLMVQCMETWCAADRAALRDFFGQYLNKNALPPTNNLEAKAKDDIQTQLMQATKHCGRDRMYQKGKRSFELLGQLDPDTLKQHLPHFVRLCDMLEKRLR